VRRAVLRATSPPTAAKLAEGRQLLIDVSVLACHDAGTGIQKATKALLAEMLAAPPPGYHVRTVRASRWRPYRYLGGPRDAQKVQVGRGDVFLGLDLASRILPRHRLQLLHWRAEGAQLCFVVYDLLPLLRPCWFTRRNSRAYESWIRTVAIHADSVACISQFVAVQLRSWLTQHGFDVESSPEVGWFHLGAQPASGRLVLPHAIGVECAAGQRFILMVGTVEPRKGYALALDAFEALWRNGHPIQLVIVGRAGWKVAELISRLRRHPEAGKRLHWMDNVDDLALQKFYATATGVLVASEAEGFGLPILEAAIHGTPLLLRDLPVFREIAGDGATYFNAISPVSFVDELESWLAHVVDGKVPSSRNIAVQSWEQSAHQMLRHALARAVP
jgi:glycosyltransferase involved in cell wall biosynthesis